MNNNNSLDDLNNRPELDSNNFLNQFIIDDENEFNIFNGTKLGSLYYDFESFVSLCRKTNKPIILSINIQSVQSKLHELISLIMDMCSKNIYIDVISLQETWAVPFPEAVSIPGYQSIVLNCRKNSRGGGVGFYVRNNIEFKVLQNLSPFKENIIESLSIRLKYPKFNLLVTNIYRSPNPPPNQTQLEALNMFTQEFDTLLDNLAATGLTSFVVTDSNINLLHENTANINYIDTIMSNGYLQTITKATRIHDTSLSLIDHVLTNVIGSTNDVGTLVNNISDHFINFFFVPANKHNRKPYYINKRIMSKANKERFRDNLSNLTWRNVTNATHVDLAFDAFWTDFKLLYDMCFPLTRSHFNKNIHPKQPFMTKGLLISRSNKEKLHKNYLCNTNTETKANYTKYRNIYASLIRLSKKMYYESSLHKFKKKTKKKPGI